MRAEGKIVFWDTASGKGYALAKAGGCKIYIEEKDFTDSTYIPTVGQAIKLTIKEPQRGKPVGESITLLGNKVRRKKLPTRSFTWAMIALTALLAAWLVSYQIVASSVLIYYGVLSLVSLSCYLLDKRAARKDLWRFKERNLQLVALLGGWPGALLGQGLLRHKTSKLYFLSTFYCIVLLHLALLFWYLTEQGNLMIRSELINLQFHLAQTGYFEWLQVWGWKLVNFLQSL